MTDRLHVGIIANMKAELLYRSKNVLSDGAIVEVVIWKLPHPVPGSEHVFKYRLFYGYEGRRIVGYDTAPPLPPPPPIPEAKDDIDALKIEVSQLRQAALKREEEIGFMRVNPKFTQREHFYFNFNGVINAGFSLLLAFIILEYVTFGDRLRASLLKQAPSDASRPLIEDTLRSTRDYLRSDFAILMAALAVTVVICGLVVSIARDRNGRSFAIINRAFQLSLIVAILAFVVVSVGFLYPKP